MIEFERVLGAFSRLAELDEYQARQEEPLVQLAIGEVSVMLRPGACTPETHDRICHACAALAYHKYAVVQATREQGFSAGDIRVTPMSADQLAVARQLREDALGSIADLVDAGCFAFLQV